MLACLGMVVPHRQAGARRTRGPRPAGHPVPWRYRPGQRDLGLPDAQPGRSLIPPRRFGGVGRDPAAVFVGGLQGCREPRAVVGRRPCGTTRPPGETLLDDFTAFMQDAQSSLRFRDPACRGFAIPLDSLRSILIDAQAVEVHAAETELGLGVPESGPPCGRSRALGDTCGAPRRSGPTRTRPPPRPEAPHDRAGTAWPESVAPLGSPRSAAFAYHSAAVSRSRSTPRPWKYTVPRLNCASTEPFAAASR